eukprot:CAMPEP_0181507434 /NCGR_PEP_ID=MMETSP1110-20121109/59145_1 /TAXON_ID=174948 /ORGANISM="Symbiodinium sp., Strain CCMP421" /LENGTH=87 /DNA_ID=CAMNT_0023636597 /DNA_START=250 /DNA_END=510 /DNA_ORIENTATION=-
MAECRVGETERRAAFLACGQDDLLVALQIFGQALQNSTIYGDRKQEKVPVYFQTIRNEVHAQGILLKCSQHDLLVLPQLWCCKLQGQ